MLKLRTTAGQRLGSVLALLVALQLTACTVGLAQQRDRQTQWHIVSVPDAWRKVPSGELAPRDGYSWYRCRVQVPASWQGDRLTLYVESLDDARATYFAGFRVGSTGTFPPQYRSGLGQSGRYDVPGDVVSFGNENTIAIRVYQYDPRPNFSVAPPVLLNADKMEAVRMDGDWQYRPGDDSAWASVDGADFLTAGGNSDAPSENQRGIFSQVDQVEDIQRYVARRTGDNDPLSPQQAEQTFQTPDDLRFQLVLAEPDIAQPLFMTWDGRGRMWLMEYRQYPKIAGLKMISRDVYLRTIYDKIPQAPPNHDRGRDRISIHEDSDGDGVYDTHKVFVDGLNLATSCAVGSGGVWVTNPPYLLFYPDRDGDDVPDGDPEVHLEGFGLEDSHSVINSLRFGPDGWLYGAQGSTVTASVRRPGSEQPPIRTMGQQIWRYHPQQRRFEVFAEGGGNTFGVEIDSKGRIYSGHNGGDTRGFHYVQGGYYRKGFGKHGPLSNPYAFGYFNAMKHRSVPRFTHNFVIYEDDTLPASYRGNLFGIEPLQGQVVMSRLAPFQSSFQTDDISRPITTDDQWFRPVDIKVGPDGCIYVADFYEQRIDHSSHYAGRIDRTNGRVYRLRPKDLPETVPVNLDQLDGQALIDGLTQGNRWQRQTIIRILNDRRDSSLAPMLAKKLQSASGQDAIEYFWALHACDGLSDSIATALLKHPDPYVRAWTVRIVCDRQRVSPLVTDALSELAAAEPYIQVRKQLASSAARLPAAAALPILAQLLKYDEDADDIHQPLLLWWALESKADSAGRDLLLDSLAGNQELWPRPLMQQHIIVRLMKRFALSATRKELMAAARLLNLAPDDESKRLLLTGFEEAYQGRSLANIPSQLVEAIAASGGGSTALRLRQADRQAIDEAIQFVTSPDAKLEQKREFLRIFGEIRRPEFVPILLQVIQDETDAGLVSAALTALQSFEDARIGETVTRRLPELSEQAHDVAETLLSSRRNWALELLTAVDDGQLKPTEVSATALRKILLHADDTLSTDPIGQLVSKHWGQIEASTTEQMREEINRLATVIAAGAGNPKRGKPLYQQHCGKCHTLFGEGGQVGPDLTSFQRDDLQRMLLNIVNPSIEIREGFENYVLLADDGRVVNGFLADQDGQVVVLRGVDGQNLIFRRDEIEDLRAIPRSVMPEGALQSLTEQQIRDLIAYLRSSQPVNY